MDRKSVFTKLSNIGDDRAALFKVGDDYKFVLSSNNNFDKSIESMINSCVGVYNKEISESALNDDIDFMEARK